MILDWERAPVGGFDSLGGIMTLRLLALGDEPELQKFLAQHRSGKV